MGKIGEKIKRGMERRGIKYEEIGKKLGISKQGVEYLLNKKRDEKWKEYEIEWWERELKIKIRGEEK